MSHRAAKRRIQESRRFLPRPALLEMKAPEEPSKGGKSRLDILSKEELSKFPEENPNPVMRVAKSGILLYANPASIPI